SSGAGEPGLSRGTVGSVGLRLLTGVSRRLRVRDESVCVRLQSRLCRRRGVHGSGPLRFGVQSGVRGQRALRERGAMRCECTASAPASLLAPFIDVYPNPAQGFHFEVAAGYAVASPGKSDKIVDTSLTGGGFGAMAGIGVEGWVGPQWSMGMLARVQYISVQL